VTPSKVEEKDNSDTDVDRLAVDDLLYNIYKVRIDCDKYHTINK